MSARPNLVALPGYADRPEPDVLFCAHCGSHAPDGATPLTRVCGDCGLGLLVGAAPSLAPQPGEAFLLVDNQLAIRELSREAQALLGVTESESLNLRVTDALMPADCEVDGVESLVNLLVHAARGQAEEGPAHIVVRPAREFGIRLWARIGPCGPPRGALVVLRADSPR